MSRFDDYYSDAAATAVDELADLVDYTPAGGQLVASVPAILGPESIDESPELDGRSRKHVRTAVFPRTAAAAGGSVFVAKCLLNDVVTIGDVPYVVDEIKAETANTTHVQLSRVAQRERTREGFHR